MPGYNFGNSVRLKRQAYRYRRICDECGQEYKAARQSSRYCGGTCRQRANRSAAGPGQPPVAK